MAIFKRRESSDRFWVGKAMIALSRGEDMIVIGYFLAYIC